MAPNTGVKFSDLQIQKRYKRLERSLKLSSIKKGKKEEGDNSWILPTSPRISSINVNAFDSSTNAPYFQTSRNDSEIVSSSNNLRNTLLKKEDTNNDRKVFATSSIKKYNNTVEYQEDYFKMPPPSCDCILRTKKLSGASTCAIKKVVSISQSDCSSSDIEQCSDIVKNKKNRIFRRWKVMLNERNQLIIKGIIENGQIARSKPIIRRLTLTAIQSVSKHVYYLQGNIVDDEYELPDYVRSKFYNGFPDDWENVYQIWIVFVQQGSKVTFHWPIPITDSDDDLKSKVTGITYAFSKSPEDKILDSKSVKETHVSPLSFKSEDTFNVFLSGKDNKNNSTRSHETSDSFTQTHISDLRRNLFCNVAIQTPTDEDKCDKENCRQQENVILNCFYDEKTKKLKDKMNVIVDNLADINCPPECINKIVEIFDCIKYIVTYGSIKDDQSHVQGSKLKQNESMVQNEATNNSQECCTSKSLSLENVNVYGKDKCEKTQVYNKNSYFTDSEDVNNKIIDINNLLHKKETFSEMNTDIHNDSGSEVYTGIPKISAERILRPKKTLMKSCKRKIKKKVMHQKDNLEKKCTSEVSVRKGYGETTRAENINNMNIDDSDVSIIQGEIKFPKINRFINFIDVDNDISKHSDFDVVEKEYQERTNTFVKDRNVYKIQKNVSNDKLKSLQKSVKDVCDSPNTENNNCKTNRSVEEKTKTTETNSAKEISEKAKDLNRHIGNKTPGPVVISSISVNTNIIKKQNIEMNLIENKSNDIKKVNEETRCLISKDSSLEEIKQNEDDCKPKLLSTSVPRIINDTEMGLVFEGNLLNDAGHIVNRKFKTDIVRNRPSPRLIEIENRDFYKLVGDLNETKHVVPKELVSQCRHGCPSKIDQFCKTRQSLQTVNDTNLTLAAETMNNTVDDINISVSSKGRRIIPPLSYWTGERVIFKNDNLVYIRGISKDNLYGSPNKSKRLKMTKKQDKKTTDKSKLNILDELKNTAAECSEKSVNMNIKNNLEMFEGNRRKEPVLKNKRRTAKRTLDSSDLNNNKNVSVHKKKSVKTNKRNSSSSMNATNKEGEKPKKGVKSTTLKMKGVDSTAATARAYKKISTTYQHSAERSHDVVCTFYQGIPFKDDILSDDQDSHV